MTGGRMRSVLGVFLPTAVGRRFGGVELGFQVRGRRVNGRSNTEKCGQRDQHRRIGSAKKYNCCLFRHFEAFEKHRFGNRRSRTIATRLHESRNPAARAPRIAPMTLAFSVERVRCFSRQMSIHLYNFHAVLDILGID